MSGKDKAGEKREMKLNDRLKELEADIATKTELLKQLDSQISGIDHLPEDLQKKIELYFRPTKKITW